MPKKRPFSGKPPNPGYFYGFRPARASPSRFPSFGVVFLPILSRLFVSTVNTNFQQNALFKNVIPIFFNELERSLKDFQNFLLKDVDLAHTD
jgi:hypothetical protein